MHILPNYVILQNLCVRVEQDVLTPHATIAVQLVVTNGAPVTACVGLEVQLVTGDRLVTGNRLVTGDRLVAGNRLAAGNRKL